MSTAINQMPDPPTITYSASAMSVPETPPPPKPDRIREVIIVQKDYGYLVSVGCQVFCIEKKEKLIRNLTRYLDAPEAIENFWLKRELKLDL